ncbi:uncharacterized protein LOC100578130 isoform X2 [Apis mellifera]|uniref:Uncharacterized protein LOC100578130 isoform X2 n=1 Tax=Apis mellifera TaxID=7460 RepID=A0A7M7M4Y2_APIME|nr:uncharacterized protein LOC100578130 isoform X2 [Apis mellifera]|eukprot:XP_016769677.1 uncharacterized protein LOC100578130 isoform X2 [Apis mellifera]
MRGLWPVMLILARILEPLLGDDGCHRNDTDHAIPCQRSREELVLSRRRRLAFPQGSTFVVTASILQPIPVKLPSNWNLVFEFDVIWPIPTTEDYKRKKYKKYKRRQWMVKRRHRRELYATFETALNRYKQPKLAGKRVHVENDLRGENFVESTWRFLRGGCPSIDIKQRRQRETSRFLRCRLQNRDAVRSCLPMPRFSLKAATISFVPF